MVSGWWLVVVGDTVFFVFCRYCRVVGDGANVVVMLL